MIAHILDSICGL